MAYSFFFSFLSDGVGRTGVFCALCIVLERMRCEGVVDLFQTVKLLRTQRPNMIQNQVCISRSLFGLTVGSWIHGTKASRGDHCLSLAILTLARKSRTNELGNCYRSSTTFSKHSSIRTRLQIIVNSTRGKYYSETFI